VEPLFLFVMKKQTLPLFLIVENKVFFSPLLERAVPFSFSAEKVVDFLLDVYC